MPQGVYPRTAQHCARIAAALRGKKRPSIAGDRNAMKRPEVRAKASTAMRGVPHLQARGPLHHNWKGFRDPQETKPCECGCGVPILRWQRDSGGKVRATENRFALGHHNRGLKRPYLKGWLSSYARDPRRHPSGSKHWNWKGGISSAERALRSKPEYVVWRDTVYRRDNWTCVFCGMKCQARNIAADHIKDWHGHPAYRYDVKNGRTLCRSCHAKRHGLGIAVR